MTPINCGNIMSKVKVHSDLECQNGFCWLSSKLSITKSSNFTFNWSWLVDAHFDFWVKGQGYSDHECQNGLY